MARLCVVLAQSGLFMGYLVFGLTTEAPPEFSTAGWLLLLVPPALCASLLVLGLRLRPARPSWLRAASLFGNALVALGLAFTLLGLSASLLVPDM